MMFDMNTTVLARVVCMAVALTGAAAAHAQPPSESSLDVTIRLLPENAVGPEEITRRIELPPAAEAARPPQAAEAGPPSGVDGPGRGQEVSSEARERGREFGQEVAEQARGNRENAGRPDNAGPPEGVPGPPDGVPGPPDDLPGPPDDLPGPPDDLPSPPGDQPGPPNEPPGPPAAPPGRP
jgi:hypothetical protein